MAQESLIDRTFLEKLERLAIHWRKSFPGLVGGHNLSRFSGPGQEFLDHRHFHHGDDLRAVNWRAYLRFEKLFLKMFRVEPHIPIRLLLDVSLSMETGAAPEVRRTRGNWRRRCATWGWCVWTASRSTRSMNRWQTRSAAAAGGTGSPPP